MWTHTVLEIYPEEVLSRVSGDVLYTVPWPTSGTPADWIEKGLIGYCQGEERDLVSFIPLWQLLWWRVQDWVHRMRGRM